MHTHIDFDIVRRLESSALKTAAYLACDILRDGDRIYDFSRKQSELVETSVLLPTGCPSLYLDPQQLWSSAEGMERQGNGQLARQVLCSIPREVPRELWSEFAHELAAPWVADGMACHYAIHDTRAADGGRNAHVHFQLSMRRMTDSGFAKTKVREWNQQFRGPDHGKAERQRICDRANALFVRHALSIKMDPRTLAEQGIGRQSELDAPRHDWKRWLREGARPENAPILVKSVIQHRKSRAAYERVISVAESAEEKVRQLDRKIAELEATQAYSIGQLSQRRNEQKEIASPARTFVAPTKPKMEKLNMKRPQPTRRPEDQRSPREEAWMRGAGGYEALSNENQRRAKASWEKWSKKYPEHGRRHPLEDYVNYVQDRNAKREIEEIDDETIEVIKDDRVAPASQADGDDRRHEILATLLAGRYRTPEPLVPFVTKVDIDRDGRRAVLHTKSGKVLDHGDEIRHEGDLTPELAGAIVAAAASHGWQSIKSSGSHSYREAIAKASALHEPPIVTDYPLPKATLEEVTAVIAKRNISRVGQFITTTDSDPTAEAQARLEHASRLVDAKLATRPKGSTDEDEISSPRVTELIESRERKMQDARAAIATAAEHRQQFGLMSRLFDSHARHRQVALDAEAAKLDRDARRLDRTHENSIRRIDKEAAREAKDNRRALDDWEWSKPGRAAIAEKKAIEQARAGLAMGDEATISALLAGDLPKAARIAEAAQVMTDPKGAALRRLSAAEKNRRTRPYSPGSGTMGYESCHRRG